MEAEPASERPEGWGDGGQCSRSDSFLDLDAEASSAHWMFDRRDGERTRVSYNDAIGIKEDDDHSLLIFGQSTMNGKLKQVIVEDQNRNNPIEGVVGSYPVDCSAYHASEEGKHLETLLSTTDIWNRPNNVIEIKDDNADDDQNFLVFRQSTISGKPNQVVVEDQNWRNSREGMGDNYLVGSSEYHASEAGKPLETLPSTAYANVWSQQNDDKANDDQNLLVFGQNTINSKLKQVIVEDRNWERYFVGSSSFRAPEADKPLETLPSTAYADAWSQQNDVNGIEVNADDAQNLLEFGQGAVNGKLKQVVVEGQNWERYFVGSSSFNPSEADKPLENLNSTEENGTFINGDLWDDDDYEDEDDNYDDYAYENDVFDSHFNYDQAEKFDHLDFPPGVEATFPWWQKLTSDKGSICNKSIEVDKIDAKFKEFKQFDSVQDYSDHHFFKLESEAAATCVAKEPPKCWMKRIQYEWKLLQKDLPETIFIRVYEARMDLLRALIIGPSGTPYHDGLFFFDCFFPSTYPDSPPVVRYHSGGLRLNPNLYASGKVCLSLLGTWSGEGCEKWNPKTSTMLQVLVSIQALVLNANPYFNEPGYELSKSTRVGDMKSSAYNEDTFLLSCKTMLYSLRTPPKNFEDFVAGHFRKHGRGILVACRAYMNGAKVGSVEGDDTAPDLDEGGGSWPTQFKSLLKTLFEELLMEFTVKGADCSIFLAQKLRAGLEKSAGEVDTTLKL